MTLNDRDIPPTMRAMVLTGHGGIDKLELRLDFPVPRPSAGEVLVKVGACGINNTDINLRAQWYDRDGGIDLTEDVALNGVKIEKTANKAAGSFDSEAVIFPRVQGAAVVGQIVSVGSPDLAQRIGERVILDPQIRDANLPLRAQLLAYLGAERDGGFAEYLVIPNENAHLVTSSLSDVDLATFPTSYDTAEEMLERTAVKAGETVVVTGASGGVGTALIQLAKVRGARVIAIAGAGKEARLLELGADFVVPRQTEGLVAAVEGISGKRGVHVVVDVVGGPIFGDLLKMLCRGGRYATAGAIGGPIQPFDLRDLIYKDLEMFGITCPVPSTFERVVHLAAEGHIVPLVDKIYKLEELREAQSEFVKRRHIGKIVIKI